MVAIIMLLELLQGLLISESIMFSHLLDTLTEILSQFTFGNTTTATVFILQRENLEIIQLAKDAELTKLGSVRIRHAHTYKSFFSKKVSKSHFWV